MMLRERLEELGQGHLFDGLSAEQTTALLVQVDSSPCRHHDERATPPATQERS